MKISPSRRKSSLLPEKNRKAIFSVESVRRGAGATTLAETIRTEREGHGLTQTQLANLAGCGRITIVAAELGYNMQHRVMVAITSALDMDITILPDPVIASPLSPSVPRTYTGRLKIKDMMAVSRIERLTKKRVYF